MKKYYLIMLLGILICMLVSAASVFAEEVGEKSAIPVVASFSIIGEMARKVGGARVQVTVLVGRNGDAHTYEPTPQDSIALRHAAIIFENGLGFEPWLNRLASASGTHARRVVLTQGLTAHPLDKYGTLDPHVWHDVQMTMKMVGGVRVAMAEIDPRHAAEYEANANKYLQELKVLDNWVREQVRLIPPERRKLVTSHDTFGYFAKAYGFRVVGTALGVSTEAGDPSAHDLADLVQLIRKERVPAIFAENIHNPKIIETLAKEAHIRVVSTLYTDALGPEASPGGTYESLIRYNVNQIVEVLR